MKTLYLAWLNMKSRFTQPYGSHSVSDIKDYFEYVIKYILNFLIIFQSKYTLTKLKTELHLQLRMEIIVNF